jgi:hypothetical protein
MKGIKMFILGYFFGLGTGLVIVVLAARGSAKEAEEKALRGCLRCGFVYYGDEDLSRLCEK